MTIRKLREAVEAGQEVTAFDVSNVFPDVRHVALFMDALRDHPIALGSALALMQAVLPGSYLVLDIGPDETLARLFPRTLIEHEATSDTPARALLLAILKALEAQQLPDKDASHLGNQSQGDSQC